MDIAPRGAVRAASDSFPCSSCTKSRMSSLPDVDVPKRPPPDLHVVAVLRGPRDAAGHKAPAD